MLLVSTAVASAANVDGRADPVSISSHPECAVWACQLQSRVPTPRVFSIATNLSPGRPICGLMDGWDAASHQHSCRTGAAQSYGRSTRYLSRVAIRSGVQREGLRSARVLSEHETPPRQPAQAEQRSNGWREWIRALTKRPSINTGLSFPSAADSCRSRLAPKDMFHAGVAL